MPVINIDIWTAAVVSGIASAMLTSLLSQKKIKAESVVAERTKWRENIRSLSKQIYDASSVKNISLLDALKHELILRLNPFDQMDLEIIRLIEHFDNESNPEMFNREFTSRISLLLKYDWEVAKYETNFFFYPFRPKRSAYIKPIAAEIIPIPIEQDKMIPIFMYFLGLLLASGFIFCLSATLLTPFTNLAKIIADPNVPISPHDVIMAIGLSAVAGILFWGPSYTLFKVCERRCAEWLDRYAFAFYVKNFRRKQ